MKDGIIDGAASVAARATEAIWRRADFAAPVDANLSRTIVLRAPEAIVQGRIGIATDALGWLSALPRQEWFAEDTVALPVRGTVRVTALRRTVEAAHDGDGAFGAATGRRLRYRVLSEVAERDGRITDIWRVTDRAAILDALDLSPERWAAAALAEDADAAPFTPALDVPSAYAGQGARDGPGAEFADLVERAMEGAFALFEGRYAPGAELALPGGRREYGPNAARAFWLGLRAAIPDGRFEVHHRAGLEAPGMCPRVALRWSLTGKHGGWGALRNEVAWPTRSGPGLRTPDAVPGRSIARYARKAFVCAGGSANISLDSCNQTRTTGRRRQH
ncbi:SnoaL-like polyketide cyclase [Roseivivax jejudonensis]|uniref:SnoaL-like polyketide cyclase n=1 Tax=Roseivivax jejudonensis TaxID=1529041 RepID=A0A1X6ZGG8_9RHOB|nr:nuclear transport factor 2 family protein [Roseivivax jejudonensis]SLN50911.1 SnoaL-like polyketide cyclase [Roseivivax jejudonensis]